MSAPFVEIPFEAIEFLELVGGGRFGSVYRAQWQDRIVAVKKTLCFDQEATLLASLRHRNIITFYGACTAAPNSFLVTEYAEHGSLYNFLEDLERLEVRRIRQWLMDIARGIRYLHHEAPKRIIHRDLKSLNVLVCADADELVLKICDFGSSRQVSRDTKSVTSAGTVSWMAPEVIRNEHVTEKCDVWSFGVIAWELVTLETPYAGMEPYSILWLVAKHGMRLHIPKSCPKKLADLMKMCMAQDPGDRPNFEMIIKLLEMVMDDATTTVELEAFMQQKIEWLGELERITEVYSSLEADSALLAAQRAEIERREAELRMREEALRLQVHSASFFGNQVALPNTPYQHAVKSKFSSSVPAIAWSVEDVVAWISVLPDGLSRFASIFRENEINGKVLFNLTDEALREALGMTAYGERFKFLECVRNIHRSSEFPPLSEVAKDSCTMVFDDKVAVSLVFGYSHDPNSDNFKFRITPQALHQESYIQQVEFVLTCPTQPENDVQVCSKAPFEYNGTARPTDKATLMLKITFNSQLFRRHTTKQTIVIDGFDRIEPVSVNLIPKHAHLRIQPATPSTPLPHCSSSNSIASAESAFSSRSASQTAPRTSSKAAPAPRSAPPPLTLLNGTSSTLAYNVAAQGTKDPPRQAKPIGSQWYAMPGPGPGPLVQQHQLRQRSNSATSTASSVSAPTTPSGPTTPRASTSATAFKTPTSTGAWSSGSHHKIKGSTAAPAEKGKSHQPHKQSHSSTTNARGKQVSFASRAPSSSSPSHHATSVSMPRTHASSQVPPTGVSNVQPSSSNPSNGSDDGWNVVSRRNPRAHVENGQGTQHRRNKTGRSSSRSKTSKK
eukprot:m.157511 g.157511  ORF g.157511 m.157511 type:complete len:840 (-) comp16310_c0_seq2:138-2657(-)